MEIRIPENLLVFEQMYGTEEACRKSLVQLRWPDGFRCPACGNKKGWNNPKRLLTECAQCGHQTSITAGTIFHSAKLPLVTLFRMAYHLVAEKSGTNCCALVRQFGISYPTATLWRRKLREIMVRQERGKLRGTVEVDEFKLGGPAEGCCGRKLGDSQALILVMVEEAKPGVCGRVRMEYIPDATTETLTAAVQANVEIAAQIRTDGLASYNDLPSKGFVHKPIVLSKPKKAHDELPLVHRIASLFKRFILGVLQGTWTHAWLQSVLDEYAFRFNRRNSVKRPLLFLRLVEEGITRKTSTRLDFARIAALAV